ncbi:MAG TPA: hypothetical protein VM368_06445, partial [Flavisolibacter sp.]|nr:hypothetical protein [Flavisolibacter sp.]
LLRYFEKNKNKYSWNQSVDAVVFTAPNESNAKHFIGHLSSPDAWRQAVSGHADVIADSSRFEWSQIPGNTKELFRAGALTTPVVKEDGTATFAYITKVHPEKQARSFAEARGIVINDYQAELESKWIAALKKKYPVVINKSVLNALISSKKF